MKQILLIFWGSMVITSALSAQSLHLLGSGGDSSSHLDWSLGEPFIQSWVADNTLLTEGFQQPNIPGATPATETPGSQANVSVWPNPASDKLYIEAEIPVKVSLYSLTGRKILALDHLSVQQQLNVAPLTPGLYWLTLTDDTEKVVQTIKVVVAQP